MATDHIVKSYDQQITLLTRKILEMGGVVEQQIAGAIEALVNRNIEQAERVVEQDDQIDRMKRRSISTRSGCWRRGSPWRSTCA